MVVIHQAKTDLESDIALLGSYYFPGHTISIIREQ